MICILLSTYNGATYLQEFLASLEVQSHTHWHLLIRDDGSQDGTIKIIKKFSQLHAAKVSLISSDENLGIKASFNALLKEALNNSAYAYFMFADQDDVWLSDKIEKTWLKMREVESKFPNKAVLIHTDLSVTDEHLHLINDSFWNYEGINPQKNSFNRLLLQNTVTGCTVMINKNLAEMVSPIPQDAIMHDWWIGLIASKYGHIDFLNESTILYRQHHDNDTGAKNFSVLAVFKKAIRLLLHNELYLLLDKNLSQADCFLDVFEQQLSLREKRMLDGFKNIKKRSFLERKKHIVKYQLLKQGVLRNLGLLLRI